MTPRSAKKFMEYVTNIINASTPIPNDVDRAREVLVLYTVDGCNSLTRTEHIAAAAHKNSKQKFARLYAVWLCTGLEHVGGSAVVGTFNKAAARDVLDELQKERYKTDCAQCKKQKTQECWLERKEDK